MDAFDLRLAGQNVDVIAETLNVDDAGTRLDRGDGGAHLAHVGQVDLQTLRVQVAAETRGCVQFFDLADVHEGDARATLGLVQVRRGDENRQAFGCQVRERIPKFAARDGIYAGGRLV